MLGTGSAFLIYYYIIETLGSVRAAVAPYIALVVAVVIGAIIGENITSLEVVALLLIIGGVLLIQTSRIKQSNPI
jgi:drug/metabolite transporter (DMT)-like permease